MHTLRSIALVLVGIGVALSGCSRSNEPGSVFHPGPEAGGARVLPDQGGPASTVFLSGYDVRFDGRTFDGTQTTFAYTIFDAGGGSDISQFALELPPCAPELIASSPGGGEPGIISQTGLYSIKWGNIGMSSGGSAGFSITFPGDVPLGYVHAQLKATSGYETAIVRGPCGGYVISGVVFADADGNESQKVENEPGIPGVTVTLVDGDTTETATTDAFGAYSFLRPEGTYTVQIDSVTPQNDFNEELFESFDASTPVSRSVTVGPDSPDNNFGFTPKTEKIIFELETGILLTDGESAKYWTAQVRTALKNGKGNGDYTLAEMEAFVAEIQALFLPDPFAFTPGNELMEALDILKDQSKDETTQLLRELLAAEFNEVAGKGLVGEDDLQRALLSWVESVVAQSTGAAAAPSSSSLVSGKGGDEGPQRLLDSPTTDSVTMLRLLNGASATGGGGGGEG